MQVPEHPVTAAELKGHDKTLYNSTLNVHVAEFSETLINYRQRLTL
jgi:hypothetical protein